MTSQFLVFGATPQGLQLNAERVQEIARVDDHGAVALEAHPVRQSWQQTHIVFHAKIAPGVEFRVGRNEVEGGVDGDAVLEAAQPHARVPRLRHVLLPVGRRHAHTVLKYTQFGLSGTGYVGRYQNS